MVQDKLCIIACNSKVFKQRSGFDPKIVLVKFLVNKAALVQTYLPVHLSPVQGWFYHCEIFIFFNLLSTLCRYDSVAK
jgi:hypothetical protein